MSTIKLNELATTNISLTDFFAKADNTGLMTKNTISELATFFTTVGEVGFKGKLLIADTPSVDGWWIAGESGTYTNAGGLVVSLTNQFVIIVRQTTFSKIDIPLNITFDATPTEGSTNAVTSEGIKTYVDSKEVATSPTPVEGGTDAFSTGGAFTELSKKQDKITEILTLTTGGVNESNGVLTVNAGSKTTQLRKLEKIDFFKVIDSNTYNSGQKNVYWFIENNGAYTLVSSENRTGTFTINKKDFVETATHVVITYITGISPNAGFSETILLDKYVTEETNYLDSLLVQDNFNENEYNLKVSIIDPSTYQNSKTLNASDGVVISSGASSNLSGFGEVIKGKTYFCPYISELFTFNEKQNYLGLRNDLVTGNTDFTIPSDSDIRYIRINSSGSNLIVLKDYIVNGPNQDIIPTYNEKKVLTQKNIYKLPIQGFGDSIIARHIVVPNRDFVYFSYGGCISSLIRDKFIELVKIDNSLPFIYIGHNNVVETDIVIDDVEAMVNHLGHQRFLIASGPTGVYSSELDTIDFVNNMKKIETRLEATYGKNYLNMRAAAVYGYNMGGVRLTQSFVQPPLDNSTTVNIYVDKFEFMTTENSQIGEKNWIPSQNLFKIGLNEVYDEYEIVSSTLVSGDDGYLTCKLVTNDRIAVGQTVDNIADSQIPAGDTVPINFTKYLKVAKSADLYLKSLETSPSSFNEDAVHPSKWGGAFTGEQIAIRLSTLNY